MHAVENTGHREHRDNYCRFNVSILQLQKALTIEGKSKLWAVVYATGYRQNITPSQCLILETRIRVTLSGNVFRNFDSKRGSFRFHNIVGALLCKSCSSIIFK